MSTGNEKNPETLSNGFVPIVRHWDRYGLPPLVNLYRPVKKTDPRKAPPLDDLFRAGIEEVYGPGHTPLKLFNDMRVTLLSAHAMVTILKVRAKHSPLELTEDITALNGITKNHKDNINQSHPAIPIKLGELCVMGKKPHSESWRGRRCSIGVLIIGNETHKTLEQERISGVEKLLPQGLPGGSTSVRAKYTSDSIPHISLGSVSNYDRAVELAADLNEAGVLAGTKIVLDKAQVAPIRARAK